ncbi:MAG: MBL fold metallo-hydrolase [Bacillota bacterium]
MRFCSLSSCSYANSVVVQDGDTCLLVDCGLRKRDIKPFLNRVGLSAGDIDAVLVTHCHTDHVYGLRFFLKEKGVPVYSTGRVIRQLAGTCAFDENPGFGVMQECEESRIGGIRVTPIRLSHDVETVGFILESGGERLGLFTDTGFVPEECLVALRSLDYLYIESNHDVELYRRSLKPRHVIRRNLGPAGHLSNDQCADALGTMDNGRCRLVVLGHLSEEDNSPARAIKTAGSRLAGGVGLAVAPPRFPGEWSDELLRRNGSLL